MTKIRITTRPKWQR